MLQYEDIELHVNFNNNACGGGSNACSGGSLGRPGN